MFPELSGSEYLKNIAYWYKKKREMPLGLPTVTDYWRFNVNDFSDELHLNVMPLLRCERNGNLNSERFLVRVFFVFLTAFYYLTEHEQWHRHSWYLSLCLSSCCIDVAAQWRYASVFRSYHTPRQTAHMGQTGGKENTYASLSLSRLHTKVYWLQSQ